LADNEAINLGSDSVVKEIPLIASRISTTVAKVVCLATILKKEGIVPSIVLEYFSSSDRSSSYGVISICVVFTLNFIIRYHEKITPKNDRPEKLKIPNHSTMAVADLILFVASNSRPSLHTLSVVERMRIPVNVVKLDTAEARQTAMKGKYFQITNVPTLVVIYADGNLQLFVGAPKINQWIGMLQGEGGGGDRSREDAPEAKREEEYQEPPPKPQRRTPVIETMPEEEDEETPEPVEGKKKRVKSKKKRPPVSFEAEEPEPEPPKEKEKSKMSDIVNIARQLEQERKESLGYDESKLPKF
jgi:hypothetical protein